MDSFNAANAVTCNYTYDDLGRLGQIDCGAGNWGQTYTYDSFGNISWAPLSGHTGSQFQPVYDTSKNRISSFGSYDANGNLTSDGLHTYAWDADGNLSQLDGATAMVYDAFGRRVEQTTSSGTTEILYGPNGSKLALMSGQTVTKAFVPLPGGTAAVYTGSTLAWYRHPDWLGSSRLASTPSGGVSYDGAYAPFGETEAESGTTDRTFTGQNQDLTANLYDFPYREYNPLHGRWISPDPAGAAAADPASPQSRNRYAYVNGSPLNSVDPFGLGKCMLWDACAEAILHSEENTETGVYGSAVLLGTMLGVPVTLWSPTQYTTAPPALDYMGPGFYFTEPAAPQDDGPSSMEMMLFVSSGGARWVRIAWPGAANGGQTRCTGSGRGLAGNTRLVGRQGAIPGQTIQPGTAAVIPQQFGLPSGTALGPYAPHIYGTIGQESFSKITDVMGGKSPIPGLNVRTAMQRLFPRQLIVEIPGAADQGANAPVTIFVPQELGCPAGTRVAGGE